MIRFLILAGYFELMMYLQVSGKLNQFINVHYRYLAILSMILSLILAVYQLIKWVKGDQGEDPAAHHHDHDHGLATRRQRVAAYTLLALPIIVGLTFPTVSLNTTVVEAKGFQFPVSKESTGDPEMATQYLQPDTSIYFNKTEYQKQMTALKEKYGDGPIKITDENYLEVMELIYNYPSDFIGRQISYEGFIFKAKTDQGTDDFVFRFGIIHCVADSGVFGLRVKLPEDVETANNQWVHIDGTITTEYYQPFKRELPLIEAQNAVTIKAPANQYVYRSF